MLKVAEIKFVYKRTWRRAARIAWWPKSPQGRRLHPTPPCNRIHTRINRQDSGETKYDIKLHMPLVKRMAGLIYPDNFACLKDRHKVILPRNTWKSTEDQNNFIYWFQHFLARNRCRRHSHLFVATERQKDHFALVSQVQRKFSGGVQRHHFPKNLLLVS